MSSIPKSYNAIAAHKDGEDLLLHMVGESLWKIILPAKQYQSHYMIGIPGLRYLVPPSIPMFGRKNLLVGVHSPRTQDR